MGNKIETDMYGFGYTTNPQTTIMMVIFLLGLLLIN